MHNVNLLMAILMPYLVRSFYEHSTPKLLLKILLPQSKKLSFQRFCTKWLKYYTVLKLQNYIQSRAQCCQKYASYQKNLQIKVVRNWISYKKVPERIRLSPPRVELGDAKDWYGWNIIVLWNGKLHYLEVYLCV